MPVYKLEMKRFNVGSLIDMAVVVVAVAVCKNRRGNQAPPAAHSQKNPNLIRILLSMPHLFKTHAIIIIVYMMTNNKLKRNEYIQMHEKWINCVSLNYSAQTGNKQATTKMRMKKKQQSRHHRASFISLTFSRAKNRSN